MRRVPSTIGAVTTSASSSKVGSLAANGASAPAAATSSDAADDLHVDAVVADARLELVGRALRDRAAVVEHDDVVGEAVGLFEVLRREDQRGALAHELAQQVPEVAAAARVETGGRLVEEQHLGRRDEAGGEVEPAAHAAGERLHELVGVVGEVEQLEQLVGAAGGPPRFGQVVQPTDHLEVEPGAHQPVDRGLLRGDADAPAHRGGVGDDVEAGDAWRAPSVGVRERGEDADRGGLAGAVVAEQAEHGARRHVEVEVAQGPEVAEALAEALGVHPGLDRRGVGRADS